MSDQGDKALIPVPRGAGKNVNKLKNEWEKKLQDQSQTSRDTKKPPNSKVNPEPIYSQIDLTQKSNKLMSDTPSKPELAPIQKSPKSKPRLVKIIEKITMIIYLSELSRYTAVLMANMR